MSKPPKAPGLFMILVHIVLILVTFTWWLLPLSLYYISMAVYREKPNVLITAIHTLCTTVTFGFYLLPLAIHYIIQYKKK